MKKALLSFVASLGLFAVAAAGPSLAANPPQFEDGPPIYRVNGGGVANVGCGDILTFSVLAHNVNSTGAPDDFSELQNVVVRATLPNGQASGSFTSTLTLSASNAEPVSESVIVNIASPAAIQLVSGPAGITQGGASLGTVPKEKEVSFQAKVVCPTPAAVVTPPTPDKGAPAPVTPAVAAPLAKTGPEDFALIGAFLTSLLATSYALSRRLPASKRIEK